MKGATKALMRKIQRRTEKHRRRTNGYNPRSGLPGK